MKPLSHFAQLMLAAGILGSPTAMDQQATKREPRIIQEQRGFAMGGAVLTELGTFDPVQPAESRRADTAVPMH
jgi:hypothetical protein